MKRKLVKIGTSYGVIIPPAYLELLNIKSNKNYETNVKLKNNDIVISDFREVKNA